MWIQNFFTEQSDLSDNEEDGLHQIKDKAEKGEEYPVNREEIIDAVVAKMKDIFVKSGLMVTTAGSSSEKSPQDKDGDKQDQTKSRKRQEMKHDKHGKYNSAGIKKNSGAATGAKFRMEDLNRLMSISDDSNDNENNSMIEEFIADGRERVETSEIQSAGMDRESRPGTSRSEHQQRGHEDFGGDYRNNRGYSNLGR